ncbi:MAG: hypothetical protein DLM68_02320 [Hyphomicrobiales bacterium]|nr:MAG: hypothetical protein DLM68_02320 [Hyphomicrobiales bacterium]
MEYIHAAGLLSSARRSVRPVADQGQWIEVMRGTLRPLLKEPYGAGGAAMTFDWTARRRSLEDERGMPASENKVFRM